MKKVSHDIMLKKIREDRGFLIKDLAAQVGLTPQGLSLLERGITKGGRLDTWQRIEAILKVPIDKMRKPYNPQNKQREKALQQ